MSDLSGHLHQGDRVQMSVSTPIDFEGVGPLPGAAGKVVAPPQRADPQQSWRVKFDGHRSDWPIPERYLRKIGPKLAS